MDNFPHPWVKINKSTILRCVIFFNLSVHSPSIHIICRLMHTIKWTLLLVLLICYGCGGYDVIWIVILMNASLTCCLSHQYHINILDGTVPTFAIVFNYISETELLPEKQIQNVSKIFHLLLIHIQTWKKVISDFSDNHTFQHLISLLRYV